MRRIKAKDVRVGDMVDGETCTGIELHPSAKYQLIEIVEVDREGDLVRLGCEGIFGKFTFPADFEMDVQKNARLVDPTVEDVEREYEVLAGETLPPGEAEDMLEIIGNNAAPDGHVRFAKGDAYWSIRGGRVVVDLSV